MDGFLKCNYFRQEPEFVEELSNGIVKLHEGKLIDETLNAAKNLVENISETVLASDESKTFDGSNTLMSLVFKFGVILLFIVCFMYILRKFNK